MATSFEPFSFSPSATTFNPLVGLRSIDDIDWSLVKNFNLGDVGSYLAEFQKINDPKTYETFQKLKLQDAPKIAETYGWNFASAYATPESTAANEKLLKSLYDDLIAYGYSPEIAKANTYDVAISAYQKSAYDQASVKNYNPVKEALTASLPLLLSIALPGLGSAIGSSLGATGVAANVIGGGIVGGGLSAATGGDFLQGALGGALGAGAGAITPGVSEALGGGTFGNVAAGALTGGGVSALMGGDFATGALKGGVGAGISDYQQQLRQEQFDTAMTESGLAGQTSIDEFVAPQVDLTAPSVQDVINQISAPADQVDDGVQEIVITAPREQTVPTQADMQSSIDALLLQLAPYEVTSENIDLNKFVNELVDGVPAEPDMQPEAVDNSKLIAALDVLKVLSPVAITALLAKNKTSSGTDEQTGYPILPIPGDWKSPTYNQAFTPSAPIDFGTPSLLAGTQWETLQQFQAPQEYNLSNLINTLNYQSVPFVSQQYEMPQQVSTADFMSQFQAPTVGTYELIGNLGGKPVSIADIISGIQSQYG